MSVAVQPESSAQKGRQRAPGACSTQVPKAARVGGELVRGLEWRGEKSVWQREQHLQRERAEQQEPKGGWWLIAGQEGAGRCKTRVERW